MDFSGKSAIAMHQQLKVLQQRDYKAKLDRQVNDNKNLVTELEEINRKYPSYHVNTLISRNHTAQNSQSHS